MIMPFPAPLSPPVRRILEDFPALIDRLFPLPGRFRAGLPRGVAELSRLLTSGRGERGEGYLSRPPLLSAYLRYFLPWNLYRLARILPALPLVLKDGDAVTDLGAGPLTLALALWISRPEFRSLALEIRCLDRTETALKAGKQLFTALAGTMSGERPGGSPWKIRTIHAPLDAPVKGPPAVLVSAVNVYNEIFWDIPHTDSRALALAAGKEARRLSALASPQGLILVVEPGIPRSGEFTACLRTALLEQGRPPLAPCTHAGPCPFPGGRRQTGEKQKWCHFAFETADAPRRLRDLSAAAGLPKERAALSFLLAGGTRRDAGTGQTENAIRILSDPFPLPPAGGKTSGYGRYGCSEKGAVLVFGERRAIDALEAGSLFNAPPDEAGKARRDPKTGSTMVPAPDA
jgi:hypothetical protein